MLYDFLIYNYRTPNSKELKTTSGRVVISPLKNWSPAYTSRHVQKTRAPVPVFMPSMPSPLRGDLIPPSKEEMQQSMERERETVFKKSSKLASTPPRPVATPSQEGPREDLRAIATSVTRSLGVIDTKRSDQRLRAKTIRSLKELSGAR